MAQATSAVYAITAPKLQGVWIHDPENAIETSSSFPYGNVGRSEGLSVQSTALQFIGRALPVYDMGGFESQELDISIDILAGPDEQGNVDWFRNAVRARKVLAYRDNRGRLTYGIITEIGFTDTRMGTTVDFVFNTTDYSEAV